MGDHLATLSLLALLCWCGLVSSTTNYPGMSSSAFKGVQSVSEHDDYSSSSSTTTSPSPDLVLLNNKNKEPDDEQPEYDYKPPRDRPSNTPPLNQDQATRISSSSVIQPTTFTTTEVISPTTILNFDSNILTTATRLPKTTNIVGKNTTNETTEDLRSSSSIIDGIFSTTAKLPSTTNVVGTNTIAISPTTTRESSGVITTIETTTTISPTATTTTTRDEASIIPTIESKITTTDTILTTESEISSRERITTDSSNPTTNRISSADSRNPATDIIPTTDSRNSATISKNPTTRDSETTTDRISTIQKLMARLPTTITTTESSFTTEVPNWSTTISTTSGSRITTPRCRTNSPKRNNKPTTASPTTVAMEGPSKMEPRRKVASGLQKQVCPRPEDIHPCECIEISSHQNPEQIETVAFCKNIRNMEVLKDAMKGMQGHFIKYFVIDSCKMPPFPNGLFHNVGIGWLEMLNSTVQFQQSFFSCTNGCW